MQCKYRMWVRACALYGSHISHHFSYYPADSTRTMSEDFMLTEMPGASERGQYGDYRLVRPDVVRFVIDANLYLALQTLRRSFHSERVMHRTTADNDQSH
jgi:hypothetical protein